MHPSKSRVASSLLPAVSFPEHGHWTEATHYLVVQSIKFDNAINKYAFLFVCLLGLFLPSIVCNPPGGWGAAVDTGWAGGQQVTLRTGLATPTHTHTYWQFRVTITSNDSRLWEEAGVPTQTERPQPGIKLSTRILLWKYPYIYVGACRCV